MEARRCASRVHPATFASQVLGKSAELTALHEGSQALGADRGLPANSFFGVYDGHGGSAVATAASHRLHVLLAADPEAWRESPRCAVVSRQ